jgi:uncharacterized membrane protein
MNKVVLFTLLSTLCIQGGLFLWKWAGDELPKIGQAPTLQVVKAFATSWKWLLGLFFTNAGWLLFVKATDLGELSVIQPLMSAGELIVVLLAVWLLGERLQRKEWLGVMMTVAGAIGLAREATHTTVTAIGWFSLIIIFCLALTCGLGIFFLRKKFAQQEVPLAIAAGIGFGFAAVLTKLMTAYLSLGDQTLESAAFLINPILPFLVVVNVLSLVLLQMAFQNGRAAVIIPTQLSVVNGISLLVGVLVFSESMSPLRVISVGFVLIGAVLLSPLSKNT